MRFAKKVELKRKSEKPIQFIFSSLAILLEKIDDVKRKRAKEKRYSEKKIVKALLNNAATIFFLMIAGSSEVLEATRRFPGNRVESKMEL